MRCKPIKLPTMPTTEDILINFKPTFSVMTFTHTALRR